MVISRKTFCAYFSLFCENLAIFDRRCDVSSRSSFEPILSYAAELLATRHWQHSPQPWDQVAQLIASDTITVPTEERVFESVIAWIHHDVDTRYRYQYFLKIFLLCSGSAGSFTFRPSESGTVIVCTDPDPSLLISTSAIIIKEKCCFCLILLQIIKENPRVLWHI